MRRAAVAAITLAIAVPLVMGFEGLSLKAYFDPVKIPTICYGYTHGVEIGMIKSEKECEELLEGELAHAVSVVDKYSPNLPPTRRAALASFVYNVGEGAYSRSTLLKKLNRGDVTGACNELLRWNKAGGVVLNGLVKRREAERELCLMGDYDIATH